MGRYNTVVAEVPYGGLRSGKNGNDQDEPDVGLGSIDDDVVTEPKRRFGWRR